MPTVSEEWLITRTWNQNGQPGGISSSEEIYLDAAQGSILSSSMAAAARTGADEVSALAKIASQELQEIWSKIDFTSYTALAPYEVESLLLAKVSLKHSLSILFRQKRIK